MNAACPQTVAEWARLQWDQQMEEQSRNRSEVIKLQKRKLT